MEVSLNFTWGSVQRAASSFVDPVDVFRIVNLVSPRNWTFNIRFDAESINHLHISSDPPLTKEQVLEALNGSIPALYSFDKLSFKVEGRCHTKDLRVAASNEDPRKTVLDFEADATDNIEGQIRIDGYRTGSTVNRKSEIESWFHNCTWLGQMEVLARNYSCKVNACGVESIVKARTKLDGFNQERPVFRDCRKLMRGQTQLGQFSLICDGEKIMDDKILRHKTYGNLEVQRYCPTFWNSLSFSKYGSTQIEIDVPNVSWFSSYDVLGKKTNELLQSLRDSLRDVESSLDFELFKTVIEVNRKRMTARKMEERQDRLRVSDKVFIGGQVVLEVPTCENELVALFMKLEALQKLPFRCKILEYTSKEGIDALGDFMLDDLHVMTRSAPIEFEYDLENFIHHDHPPEQVKLIICWDTSLVPGETDTVEWKKEPWHASLTLGGYQIPVLILKNTPSLTIAH